MARSESKLPEDPRLPHGKDAWQQQLIRVLTDYLRQNSRQVNDLATGRRAAQFNETSVVPTSGIFAAGDFVPKKDAIVEGTAGTQYIHYGWQCVQEGSASASSFAALRALTGT